MADINCGDGHGNFSFLYLNKPENPFQNYDLIKNYLEIQKKFFCIKNILIQPSEVQKPDRKPDPRPGKIYVQINQYVKRNLPT